MLAFGALIFLRPFGLDSLLCPQSRLSTANNKNQGKTGTDIEGEWTEGYTTATRGDNVRVETLRGAIAELDQRGGTNNGYTYQVKMTIAIGDLGSATYYFSRSDLARVEVYDASRQLEPIPFKKLKAGDRVTVEIKTNPQLPNLQDFKITKM